MINRPATIGANCNTGLTPQTTVACRLVDEGRCWIVSADLRGRSRRQEVGERRHINAGAEPVRYAIDQRSHKEVTIDVLEKSDAAGTNIAKLGNTAFPKLMLNAKRPLLGIRRVEVGRHLSL